MLMLMITIMKMIMSMMITIRMTLATMRLIIHDIVLGLRVNHFIYIAGIPRNKIADQLSCDGNAARRYSGNERESSEQD